ncbi:hypothetical protein RS694_07890 [Rhodoferax saidenbachensis]|uniref:Chemotaxis protein CheW n=2 Tax=Rhodoferax saidenbachensis TaxID=1484693 RepID=A0A1P8KFJ9_9BURK|nr:hypothetical protein RS694_07890 [Rhodoferax saidenbachensis]
MLGGQPVDTDSNEYLAFRLGSQEYGVGIQQVQEIRSYERPNRILRAPVFLSGVLNLRSTIVPIVDLRIRLGLPTTFNSRTVIVVLNLSSGTVGVVVDAVSDVLELRPDEIQPMPGLNDSPDARLFESMGCSHQGDTERTLVILNFQDLLPRDTVQSITAR